MRPCTYRSPPCARSRRPPRETVKLTDICGIGHYGSSFSMAELVASLYYEFMHVRPTEPQWMDRDRFTMGKGHAAIGLYPVLADLGFFPWEELYTYTRLGSPYGDHPDRRKVKGADFSSGSIGHNLSVSVGMALGLRKRGSPARVVCMMGDGEQAEGQVWEAAMSGAHFGLGSLVGIVDNNAVGSDGVVAETMNNEPLADKWRAFGWEVRRIDGHDLDVVGETLDWALNTRRDRPACIIADTIAGRGVGFMEHAWQWHLGFLGPDRHGHALVMAADGQHPAHSIAPLWPRVGGVDFLNAPRLVPARRRGNARLPLCHQPRDPAP